MTHTLELIIRRPEDGHLRADARLTRDNSEAPTVLAADEHIVLDPVALLAEQLDPLVYGRLLTRQLFAPSALREAWLKATALGDELCVHLRLDAIADDLHALRWETLCAPEDGAPIALDERVRLARVLDSSDLTPVVVPPRSDLRALVVVASPVDLGRYGLADVDIDGELASARAALTGIPAALLADRPGARGRATAARLVAELREGFQIVLLVAHGTFGEGEAHIWLEHENGTAAPLPASKMVATVERLTVRPRLVVLLSCQSAGSGYDGTLNALGPQLARIGIPAVLGFQGAVAMTTVRSFLPTMLAELGRDGQMDRAVAAARAAIAEVHPWWQAVLWLRAGTHLWRDRPDGADRAAQTGGVRFGGSSSIGQVAGSIVGGNMVGGDMVIGRKAGRDIIAPDAPPPDTDPTPP